MNGDEKQKEAESLEEKRARRRERSSRVLEMLKEQEEAKKAEAAKQAAAEDRQEKPAGNTKESKEAEGTQMPSGDTSERTEEPAGDTKDAGAVNEERAEDPAEPATENMETAPENTESKEISTDDGIAGPDAADREPDGQEAENNPVDRAEEEIAQEESQEPQEPEAAHEADAPTGAETPDPSQETERAETSPADSTAHDMPDQEKPQQDPQGKTPDAPSREPAKDTFRHQSQDQLRDEDKDSRQKKGRDGQPFHQDGPPKDKDGRPKGLFARIRGLASRIYHRIKHAVERVIGRGRIPTPLRVNPLDQSRSAMDLSGKDKPSVDRATKDKDQEKQGRNWGDLLFHGFARRILGKDAYMYAVKQGEQQETSRQNQNTQGQETPGRAPQETGRADRAEHPGPQEKQSQEKAVDAQTQGQAQKQTQAVGENEKSTDKPKEPEGMKGKFNSLHKIITNDLEDRYTNAREAKDAYLSHYKEQLQEKLTEINHGEQVHVSAFREDGKLKFCINTELDSFGGYASFMGCSRIQIEVDGHLNITSAEGFIPTKQLQDGSFTGRKIDVSETLGAYIISDLAKNFREDYNRGSESYNLTSRNEFEKTVRDAAENGRAGFMIDNISYSISVNQDHSIQISPEAGGKAFTIAMDAAPAQAEAAKEAYEAKALELQNAKHALEAAKRAYSEMESVRQSIQEKYSQASEKAEAADKQLKAVQREIYQTEKQLSGTYLGAQETAAQDKKKAELETEKKTLLKERNDTAKERNLAHAALDTADLSLNEQKQKIDCLEQKAESLKEACREAKEQYDAVSLQSKETVREAYQSHVDNVTKSRESSIRVFEEILPTCKNELGGDFKLEDLNKAMEETGRTSMEEALYAHEMGSDRPDPSIGEEHETGRDDQELGAEIG